MEIKVGDKFKGKVNGAIIEITDINEKDGIVIYKADGNIHFYGLQAFKNCLLEKIN